MLEEDNGQKRRAAKELSWGLDSRNQLSSANDFVLIGLVLWRLQHTGCAHKMMEIDAGFPF